MTISEIIEEAKNQYTLYTSGEGASLEKCSEIIAGFRAYIEGRGELPSDEDFIECMTNVQKILSHHISGSVKKGNVKLIYTVDENEVNVRAEAIHE